MACCSAMADAGDELFCHPTRMRVYAESGGDAFVLKLLSDPSVKYECLIWVAGSAADRAPEEGCLPNGVRIWVIRRDEDLWVRNLAAAMSRYRQRDGRMQRVAVVFAERNCALEQDLFETDPSLFHLLFDTDADEDLHKVSLFEILWWVPSKHPGFRPVLAGMETLHHVYVPAEAFYMSPRMVRVFGEPALQAYKALRESASEKEQCAFLWKDERTEPGRRFRTGLRTLLPLEAPCQMLTVTDSGPMPFSHPTRVGIYGNSASGKTSLALRLLADPRAGIDRVIWVARFRTDEKAERLAREKFTGVKGEGGTLVRLDCGLHIDKRLLGALADGEFKKDRMAVVLDDCPWPLEEIMNRNPAISYWLFSVTNGNELPKVSIFELQQGEPGRFPYKHSLHPDTGTKKQHHVCITPGTRGGRTVRTFGMAAILAHAEAVSAEADPVKRQFSYLWKDESGPEPVFLTGLGLPA